MATTKYLTDTELKDVFNKGGLAGLCKVLFKFSGPDLNTDREFEKLQIRIFNTTGFKLPFEEIGKLYFHYWNNNRPSTRHKRGGYAAPYVFLNDN